MSLSQGRGCQVSAATSREKALREKAGLQKGKAEESRFSHPRWRQCLIQRAYLYLKANSPEMIAYNTNAASKTHWEGFLSRRRWQVKTRDKAHGNSEEKRGTLQKVVFQAPDGWNVKGCSHFRKYFQFLKFRHVVTLSPRNSPCSIWSGEMKTRPHRNVCTGIRSRLFITAKKWKQPKCPSKSYYSSRCHGFCIHWQTGPKMYTNAKNPDINH